MLVQLQLIGGGRGLWRVQAPCFSLHVVQGLGSVYRYCYVITCLLYIWGMVKIMVPFWVPTIIRGLIRGLI